MADSISPAAGAGPPAPGAKKSHPLVRLAMTLLKVAIAVLGIWWVAHKTDWDDTAVVPAGTEIRNVKILEDTKVIVENAPAPVAGGRARTQPAAPNVYSVRFPSRVEVEAETPAGTQKVEINDQNRDEFNFQREMTLPAGDFRADHGDVVSGGLKSIFITASSRWYLVVFAWVLLVTPFFVTAIRWRNLMRPQGIEMPLGKSLQLTFVGQFYSIILPGITGGDLVKIVYAARLTGSKTKSFITVVLDRVIGLIALMTIAGVAAGAQLVLNMRSGAPADNTLFNVFILIVVLLAGLFAGGTVYFSRRLRRIAGIEWFIENAGRLTTAPEDPQHESMQHRKLERLFRLANAWLVIAGLAIAGALALLRWGIGNRWAQRNTPAVIIGIAIAGALVLAAVAGLVLHGRLVSRATPFLRKIVEGIIRTDEALHVYRGHFGLLGWAFLISVISQLSLPLSAWLCGMAFGMHAPVAHYLAYVPLAVLAASLPISPPQGFGVLDGILVHFFASRGAATAAQAVTLAQSVRFLPILWNLCGAYWVITGKYSRKEDAGATAELPESSGEDPDRAAVQQV